MLKHKQDNNQIKKKIIDIKKKKVTTADFLSNSNILIFQNINQKKQLFNKLSQIYENIVGTPKSKIIKLFLDKEINESSGIGHGVAIPNIQMTEANSSIGIYIKLNKSISFDAIDNEPVDIIFALISPKNNDPNHLKILAYLSRLLTNKKTLKNLRATLDEEAIYAILTNNIIN
jgi:PTS system nitrogen regulatory IIA component